MVRKADKLQNESYLLVARRLQENLTTLRKYHNLTYEQISTKTGYSMSYLHDIFVRDIGYSVPSLDLLVKLAEIFETSPGKLLEVDLGIKKSVEEKFLENKPKL